MAKRSKIKQSSAARDADEEEMVDDEMEDDEMEDDEMEGEDEAEGTRRRSSRSSGKPRGVRGRWKAFKAWWRDARRWALPALLVAALALFVLGIAGIWFPTAFGPDMAAFYSSMGAYTSYFFLLGFIVFAAVGYFAAVYILKLREFSRLVGTRSKSDFIRTQDKIERLAFELGSHEQDQVVARKREFRIRH